MMKLFVNILDFDRSVIKVYGIIDIPLHEIQSSFEEEDNGTLKEKNILGIQAWLLPLDMQSRGVP